MAHLATASGFPTVEQCFDRRVDPGRHLVEDASEVAAACFAMGGRFHRGGKLLVFGDGASATDAQHLAVEFVHPVIVGKRALPALSLTNDIATVTGIAQRHGFDEVFSRQLDQLGRLEDIALGVSSDGNCANVLRGFETARALGLLTVALTGGDGGVIAGSPAVDHVLVARSTDPRIVKEVQVTTYHLLWELVHVFLEQPGVLEEPVR